MLLKLAISYVEAFNSGKIPTIDTAWNYVQQEELQRSFMNAIKLQSDLITEEF